MTTRKKLQVVAPSTPRCSRVLFDASRARHAPLAPRCTTAEKPSKSKLHHTAPPAPRSVFNQKGKLHHQTAPLRLSRSMVQMVQAPNGGAPKAPTRKFLRPVKFNEQHRRVGETAPGATLSDHDVELMRIMHEEFPLGHPQHIGHRRLAAIFGVSRTTASNICHYRKRIGNL